MPRPGRWDVVALGAGLVGADLGLLWLAKAVTSRVEEQELVESHDAFVGRWDLDRPPTDPDRARVSPATPCLEVRGR